jgi:serine/threonine-protein kinase
MGEVYRATDVNLKRTVAIKVLPEAMATDGERLARFQREAEVLARLNHPQIAQIYGLEKSDAAIALVMELVEGLTLEERIAQGPVAVDEALPIAKQIAEALEAAHEQGIIHRDLKPANIKLRPDGSVKVLDFGLAKMLAGSSGSTGSTGSNSLANSPTLTSPAMTMAGMILGTAAYMSPEQAKGRAVDRRADVWAFACVMYEMLTGRRAFAGDDVAEVLAAVIKSEPDWSLLPANVSPALRLHLQRALAKDPRTRVQAVGDLRLAIEGAFDSPSAMSVQPGKTARPTSALRRLAWAAAGLFVGIALTVGALNLQPDPPPGRITRFDIAPPPGLEYSFSPSYGDIAISPDGSAVVYAARNIAAGEPSIAVRHLDQLLSTRLTEWIGESPFMSPDGNWVGFFSNARLQKVPVQGGAAINICDLPGSIRGATWTEGDTIIFGAANFAGLWQVPAGGGQPVQITKSETGASHIFPEALPGNKAVLFTMWAGSNDGASIGVLDAATGTTRVLVQSGTNPKFVKSGHIVYVDRGALRAVAFDVGRLAVMSEPVTILDGVLTKPTGASNFAVADDGTLAYVAGGFSGVDNSLVWVDRQGHQEPLTGLSRQNYQIVRVSPKGTHLVTDFGQPRDVWSYDITRGTALRVTTDPSDDQFPTWSPDGERIVFTSNRSGRPEIYSQFSDGSGTAEKVFERPESQGRLQAEAWSKDGRTLILTDALGGSTTSSIQLDGDRRYISPSVGKFIEGGAALSPDGQWIAYQSNRSGAMAVYVERFPGRGSLQKVSLSGGFAARWAPDGKELYYLNPDGRSLMAVPVSTGETLKIGTERKLFDGSFRTSGPGIRPYDVTPDGKRFVMIRQDSATTESPRLIVVQHWTEELKRLVPARSR